MAQNLGDNTAGAGFAMENAKRLNRGCFCVTLDRNSLSSLFDLEVGVSGFAAALEKSHPSLFSNVPVFVPKSVLDEMLQVVAAVEATASLAAYQEAALSWAAPLAHRNFGPVGALMGYDFHMTPDGAKLIEINTNAGGAFLNSPLGRAQRACCGPMFSGNASPAHFPAEVSDMFVREWVRQRKVGRPGRIAILDDAPEEQFLLPEFELAQSLLRSEGIETVIGDPRNLFRMGDVITLAGQPVDMIYNRLVDFAFEDPAHGALRSGYEDGVVVVTPNPHVYAVFADKRNLCLLSNGEQLKAWGLATSHQETLATATLPTVVVTAGNAEKLWRERRNWFFKPARGHASRAAYRGDKLTRRVWSEIIAADYVAQAYAEPSLREVEHEGRRAELKVDLRLYTYDGEVLLTAARLYRGQTTNMRTPGGGFASVLIAQ